MRDIEPKDELTTSAREHLTIWTVLNAVDRSVVALKYLPFLACDIMYANPLVSGAAGHEAVL